LNPIEIIAESPLSAVIVASTVTVAVVHEMALATRTTASRRLARVLWGPFFALMLLFLIVASARLIYIFSE
jgi:hypothetical protein